MSFYESERQPFPEAGFLFVSHLEHDILNLEEGVRDLVSGQSSATDDSCDRG